MPEGALCAKDLARRIADLNALKRLVKRERRGIAEDLVRYRAQRRDEARTNRRQMVDALCRVDSRATPEDFEDLSESEVLAVLCGREFDHDTEDLPTPGRMLHAVRVA